MFTELFLFLTGHSYHHHGTCIQEEDAHAHTLTRVHTHPVAAISHLTLNRDTLTATIQTVGRVLRNLLSKYFTQDFKYRQHNLNMPQTASNKINICM